MIKLVKLTMEKSDHTDCRNYTEKRNVFCPCRRRFVNFVFLFNVSLLLLLTSKACAQTTNCDFFGSGLDLDGSGVQPVYLSCSAGRVEWQFPRAALRVILRYPHARGEFRGCIKASPEIEGARLFVEGHRSLIPLYSKDDGSPLNMVRCFTSYNEQVALYLEAEPLPDGFKKLKSSFEYDLQPMENGGFYDPLEECRPCTDSELVQLYCSADFVAKGFIISAKDDTRLQQTNITLSASRVFQQTTPIFGTQESFNFNDLNQSLDTDRRFIGRLFVPLHCGVRAGPGEFMFIGTLRLGEPLLRCAPRTDDWRRLIKRAQDKAHCVLEE